MIRKQKGTLRHKENVVCVFIQDIPEIFENTQFDVIDTIKATKRCPQEGVVAPQNAFQTHAND